MQKEMTVAQVDRLIMARARKTVVSLPRFVRQMDEARVESGAVFAGDAIRRRLW